MKRVISDKSQIFHISLLISEELDKHEKVIVELKRSPKTLHSYEKSV